MEINGITFITFAMPMVLLGLRHALDVDHIIAIDNLVRLHNASKKSRWVGSGFSIGHILAVIAELFFIILIVGSIAVDNITFFGSLAGVVALLIIGIINLYTIKRFGKSGSIILANKIIGKIGASNPFISSMITGMIFGLGFDTATQISAITLSAVASATLGIEMALILSLFFAIGMISLDTLDSILLRRAFAKILDSKRFKHISYALSINAVALAIILSYENITGLEIIPEFTGPIIASSILATSFAYSFIKSD